MTQRTPLIDLPGLPPLSITHLRASWWITSLEDFVALLEAPNQTHGSGLAALQQHDHKLPINKLPALLAAAKDQLPAPLVYAACSPSLGTLLDEAFQPALAEPLRVAPDLPEQLVLPVDLPAPPEPPARGAGLALALAALLQHRAGLAEPLSARFLAWAGPLFQEQRDAELGLDAALRVLRELGICRARTWPDDAHPPAWVPPSGAVEEARQWRIAAPVWHPPDDRPTLMTLLHQGQPLLLVLPVYQHWCDSWPALQLGRLRAPLYGEALLGQQALLVVGYRADPDAPGGGYLIARNSWGPAWASANPDGAGTAHIPYALLKHARAALTLTLAPDQPAPAPSALSAAALPEQAGALLQQAQTLLDTALPQLVRLQELVLRLQGQAPPAPRPPDTSVPLNLARNPSLDLPDPLAANGILANTGQPILPIDTRSAGQIARAERAQDDPLHTQYVSRNLSDQPDAGMVEGRENNLRKAGWAVVLHADEPVALLDALRPLILKRCADQGRPAPALDDFRPGETCKTWLARKVGAAQLNAPFNNGMPVLLYQTGEEASGWLIRHGASLDLVKPRLGVPFYLMLVGRPGSPLPDDQVCIPFAFQYALDIFWGVGRLCFTDPRTGQHDLDAYARYARQVVAFEQRDQAPFDKHIVYFATQHPRDLATRISANELVRPLAGLAGGADGVAARYGFTQDVFLEQHATHAQLGRILRGELERGRPALLFSATHGVGFAPDAPELVAQQGALLCQDWPGSGPPQRQHWFAADDLPEQASLEGLIAFCFACYGVGCPQADDFAFVSGRSARPVAPYPLVAQLPQRLLERGALAVLGHVDRAWSHSFRTNGVSAQTQRFESVLLRLMQGDRAGFATDQFNAMQGQLSIELADRLLQVRQGKQVITDTELGNLWAARNDARNYALLGDPAVRLPFRDREDEPGP